MMSVSKPATIALGSFSKNKIAVYICQDCTGAMFYTGTSLTW